ncbi:MAG: UbiA family prenyltransferase [Candidatus Woesearchaeota archaeon]
MPNKLQKTSDVIFFLKAIRLRDWFYLLGIPLLPYLQKYELNYHWHFFSILLFGSLYLSWGYLFNNVFDINEDNIKKNVLSKTKEQKKWFFLALGTFSILLVYSLLVSLKLFCLCILIFILNFMYSVPPLRLKENWLTSLLINGVIFTSLYLGASFIINYNFDMWFAGVIFFLFLVLQAIHELEHYVTKKRRLSVYLFFPFFIICGFFVNPIFGFLNIIYFILFVFVKEYLYKNKTFHFLRRKIRHISMAYGLLLCILIVLL